ncbi:LOW QUALITY PROTEIN: uncharacterized protein CFAP97D2 [Phaethornis superciliosus]
MHQDYQPVLPCDNKYLQLKWGKAKYEEHKKRLLAGYLQLSPAEGSIFGTQLEADLSVIRRDNCLLMEMSCIMRTKGKINNKKLL